MSVAQQASTGEVPDVAAWHPPEPVLLDELIARADKVARRMRHQLGRCELYCTRPAHVEDPNRPRHRR